MCHQCYTLARLFFFFSLFLARRIPAFNLLRRLYLSLGDEPAKCVSGAEIENRNRIVFIYASVPRTLRGERGSPSPFSSTSTCAAFVGSSLDFAAVEVVVVVAAVVIHQRFFPSSFCLAATSSPIIPALAPNFNIVRQTGAAFWLQSRG